MHLPLQHSDADEHEKPLEEQHMLSLEDLREHAPELPFFRHLSASSLVGQE